MSAVHPLFDEMFSKIFGAPAPQNVKPIDPPIDPVSEMEASEGPCAMTGEEANEVNLRG